MVNRPSAITKQRWTWRWGRYGALGLAIALLCLNLSSSKGLAQESEAAPAEATPPANEAVEPLRDDPVVRPWQNLVPPEIETLLQADTAETALATIYLDGRPLFEVAASGEEGTLTAADRANKIETRLQRVAQRVARQDSLDNLAVTDRVDKASNQPVIYANGTWIMTITFPDARLSSPSTLPWRAMQISETIEAALRQYYRERQPDFLWARLRWAAVTLVFTLLGSFTLLRYYQDLDDRRQRLKQGQSEQVTTDASSPLRPGIVDQVRNTVLTRQRVKSLKIFEQMLQLAQVVLWSGSVFLILGFFPYTRWLQPLIIHFLKLPLRLVLIALIAYGLSRLTDVWIDRAFLAVQTRAALTLENTQRLDLRLSTFSGVIQGCVAVAIAIIAVLIMLGQLGIQVTPLLAGAGLIGVALSFASQSLVKDLINGFLILLEDQYGVGDVITVRDITGFVETMNLRITQLRDAEGRLTTVPNGQIDIVQNLSKEWSRADLGIPVGLDTDINQAMELIGQIADEMSQDAAWGPLILEPPLLLGVDSLSHLGTTIRIWIKTQPLKQWDVAREYRRRLKMAFEAAHIPLGVPQQIVHVAGLPENGTVPTQKRSTPNNHTPPESPELASRENQI
ncbi:MAG: mechanosensitive ion channel domain-containing protein [Cyanobacteria bacterium J06626_18]